MKYQCSLAVIGLAVAIEAPAQQAATNVDDYVRQHPFGAPSSETAELFDSRAVPKLSEMLDSQSEEALWPTVAGMLSVVGDDQAVETLTAFVEKPVTDFSISPYHEEARKAAIMGLGSLVNRIGSERALNYLIDGLTPSVWRKRNVLGVAPWLSSYEEYDLRLSEYALFGLALSGHPRAGEALRSLQQFPTAGQAGLRAGRDAMLTQWLEVHYLVTERGLAGMYQYYETQRQLEADRQLEEVERLRGGEAR